MTSSPTPCPDLAKIARDYDRAARVYDAVARRLRAAAPAAAVLEVGEQESRVLGIVHGCVADYVARGAQAIRDVAGRLRAWGSVSAQGAGAEMSLVAADGAAVGERAGVQDRAGEGSAPGEVPPACWYEQAALELHGWVRLLADDAQAATEQTGDRALVGDTHPYCDLIYGIAIPYLLQAADILGRPALR